MVYIIHANRNVIKHCLQKVFLTFLHVAFEDIVARYSANF